MGDESNFIRSNKSGGGIWVFWRVWRRVSSASVLVSLAAWCGQLKTWDCVSSAVHRGQDPACWYYLLFCSFVFQSPWLSFEMESLCGRGRSNMALW